MNTTEYEILFLIGDSKKADIQAIRSAVEEAISASGGSVMPGEFIDERRMEYAIAGERRGTYIAQRFTVSDESEADAPGRITKTLSLNKGVLRFLIVRSEGLPTLEESQDRVRHISDTRRRVSGRYQSGGNRSRPVVSAPTPISQPEELSKPALSDTEIDKKLGEVLDI